MEILGMVFMKTSTKVTLALFTSQLLLYSAVFAQPTLPGDGDGGCTNCPPYTNNYIAPPYVPGLKMSISYAGGTNFQLTLLESDPAGRYDIYFVTNIVAGYWSDIFHGATGQSNFTLPMPVSQSGFFRVARSDEAVADAAGISVYFLNDPVNTNIISAVVESGPAATTAILVDSTNFAGATWIPFTSMPLVDIGTNEGMHEVWFGFKGTNGIIYWTSDTVTLDKTPPSVSITNPVFTTTSRPIIQVQGYSTEPLSSIYFDVTNAAGNFTNQQGFVTAQSFDTNTFASTTNWFQCFDVELTNGINTITVHAADLAGNITTTNVIVTLDFTGDTNPPVITVTWPQDGAQISGTNFTLRGVLDDETAQITAQMVDTNGVTNIVSGVVERNGAFWLEDLPLNPGTNIVTVTATDAAGNISVTNLILFQSDVALTIDLIPDDQLNLPTTTATGIVSDPSYDVWVNGVQATVDGSGNWTANNVPIYGNGTATFDAIAYPPGQSLNLRAKMNANSDESPAQTSQVREQPAMIYISEYHDNWNEDEGNYGHWTNAKEYNALIDNNGHFSFNGVATSNGDGEPAIEWWWKITYNWSDTDPGGTSTETEDEEGDIETASGPGTNPLHGYFYIPDGNSLPSSSWPGISHYYASIYYEWNEWYGTHKYSRNSGTVLKLRTGGKSGISRENLFTISAGATEYGKPDTIDWGNGPDDWFGTPATGIDPTRIHVLGKNVGKDGNLFIVLPDNATLNLGAVAPGKHYSLGVGATKHKMFIQANGSMLRPDRVVPTANYAIGEKINLSPVFIPPLPEQPQEGAKWTMTGQYINAFKVWILDSNNHPTPLDNSEDSYDSAYGLTDFRVDTARLQQVNTFAWWQTGSTTDYESKTINLGMYLTFANGQQVVITSKGLLGMHQPTVSWNANGYGAGIVAGEKVSGYGAAGLYKVGLLDDEGGMGIGMSADSQSLVPGRFGIIQLIKRNCSVPLGSWSDWELDGSMPYDNGNHHANVPYNSSGSAKASLDDAPSVTGIGGAWSQDQFKDYFMFRANTSGSIWATLGTTDWNWFGSIVWCTSCQDGWVWTETPQFYCSQSIAPSNQHPEFQITH